MQWFKLPAPGTKLGPCKEPCHHKDCEANRRDAASSCCLCGKGIGYEVAFYNTPKGYVHADCYDRANPETPVLLIDFGGDPETAKQAVRDFIDGLEHGKLNDPNKQ